MFLIKIAGVTVGIDNRYDYIEWLCRDYVVTGELPAFTVGVSKKEIRQEIERELEREKERMSVWRQRQYRPICESLCLYRKLSLNMVDCNAFLMHSAVIEVDGQAIAFAAKSGVGKSTHVRLWRERFGEGVHIINGDKPIYRFIDGQLYACGTPWRGKECWGENRMAPLKALCFLERAEEDSIGPLAPGDALDRLFHQLLLPREPERMDRFLALVDRMLETVPCWLLRCGKTPAAAETARRALNGGDRP